VNPVSGVLSIVLGLAAAGLVHSVVHLDNPLHNALLAGGAAALVAVITTEIMRARSKKD
jgi:hypothetical protein